MDTFKKQPQNQRMADPKQLAVLQKREWQMSWRVHLKKPLTIRAVTIWGHVCHSKVAFSPLSGHLSSRLSSLMAHKTIWNKKTNFRTEIANPIGKKILLLTGTLLGGTGTRPGQGWVLRPKVIFHICAQRGDNDNEHNSSRNGASLNQAQNWSRTASSVKDKEQSNHRLHFAKMLSTEDTITSLIKNYTRGLERWLSC